MKVFGGPKGSLCNLLSFSPPSLSFSLDLFCGFALTRRIIQYFFPGPIYTFNILPFPILPHFPFLFFFLIFKSSLYCVPYHIYMHHLCNRILCSCNS